MLYTSLACAAPLANVYIAQSSAGSNNGTSCANAYAATFFNTSGNWGSGSTQIGAGTVVHLCGNVTSTLTFNGSGSSGSLIELLFESGASMSVPNWSGEAINTNNQTYLLIDGGVPCGPSGGACNGYIANTQTGSALMYQGLSIGIYAAGCANCEIRNIGIYNLYVHAYSDTSVSQTQVNCVYFSGNNLSIHDSTMHDAGWCLLEASLNPNDTNVSIYNNNIYNMDHGWALTLYGTSSLPGPNAGPFYFHNNHVHDMVIWDTASDAYHHDGIHCYATPSGNTSGAHQLGLWIYNNLFDGDPGADLTGQIFLEPGEQTDGSETPCMDPTSLVYIFGNAFISPPGRTDLTGIVSFGVHSSAAPMTSTFTFYNNSLIGADPSGSSIDLRADNFTGTLAAVNNIYGGADYLLALSVTGPGEDYNGYTNCASYNCWNGRTYFSPSQSPTNWQTECSCDAHSINTVIVHTPGGYGGVNQTTGALQTGSPFISAGTNLTSAVSGWPVAQQNALFTDRNGISRGSGAWTIGAYNYIPPPGSISSSTGIASSSGVQ